jgi:hypothetical protein
VPDWRERLRSLMGRTAARPSGPDMYGDLRAMALGYDASKIEVPEGESWTGALVAVMELGWSDATVTILAVADGSVSMYLSTGGGVIGAGEHAAVRAQAERFRTVAAESRGLLQATDDFPLPDPGEVRFQVRTDDGAYSGGAPEAALRTGRHPLAPLFAAGQDLLTEIRLASPDAKEPT